MSTSSYVLTLQLKIEKYQEDILNKRFNKCRNIYNSCISELQNLVEKPTLLGVGCKTKKI